MKNLCFTVLLFTSSIVYAQQGNKIYVSDISNFWQAYDQLKDVKDTSLQQQIIQKVYLDHASQGLKDLIQIRNLKARNYIKSINTFPNFWATIRPKTIAVVNDTSKIGALLTRFKYYYPEFKAPAVYFVIGYIKTGGTTLADRVIMGTEIATGDSTVDTNGQNQLLRELFKQSAGIEGLIAHELGHTQQIGGDEETSKSKANLLGYCLREGACDFMAEVLTSKERITPYIAYGKLHEKEIWQRFKPQMFQNNTDEWLYNGGKAKDNDADLGYFMGYTICKYYFEHTADKKQVVKDIFHLDYDNQAAVNAFFKKTGYSKKFS